MTEPLAVPVEPRSDEGWPLSPGGNPTGPMAQKLIVALSECDDWYGAVLEVIDEAATEVRRELLAEVERLRKVNADGDYGAGWDAAHDAVLRLIEESDS